MTSTKPVLLVECDDSYYLLISDDARITYVANESLFDYYWGYEYEPGDVPQALNKYVGYRTRAIRDYELGKYKQIARILTELFEVLSPSDDDDEYEDDAAVREIDF
jgi:hypothetical protein